MSHTSPYAMMDKLAPNPIDSITPQPQTPVNEGSHYDHLHVEMPPARPHIPYLRNQVLEADN